MPESGPGATSRPLRAMLARGAACNLCRSRKVKCDGQTPVCSQCIKSSRGDPSVINCVYEGGPTSGRSGGGSTKKKGPSVISRSPIAAGETHVESTNPLFGTLVNAATAAAGSVGGYARDKRSRELLSDDEDEDSYAGERDAPRNGHHAAAHGSAANKKRATGGHRVETLVERISELERRLRQQTQPVPVSVHTHVRASNSPPFYPSPYLPPVNGANGEPASASMEARHSMSSFTDRPGIVEPSVKDISAAWTRESSVRFTASYASFSPTSAPVEITAPFTSGVTSRSYGSLGVVEPPQNYNGSSYPPLNYAQDSSADRVGAPLSTSSSRSSSAGTWTVPNGMTASYGQPGYSPIPQQMPDYGLMDSAGHPSAPNSAHFSATHSEPFTPAPTPPDFHLDASFFQILYPAWPSSLPNPGTVEHLVNTFFSRSTVPASMISRSRLKAGLAKPPADSGFPETALLHAMCAFACRWVSEETLGAASSEWSEVSGTSEFGPAPGRRYWSRDASPREYHYKEARREIDKVFTTSPGQARPKGNMFQILQATLLCCYIAYLEASFADLWMLSGVATRLCTPLGLNHLPSWDWEKNKSRQAIPDWRAMLRTLPDAREHSLLGEAKDVEEHYERAATWWVAFSIDRHTSASTDWSTSVDEQDVSTPLPLRAPVPAGSALSFLHDERFFTEPAPVLGSQGLYIKATILLGRVVNFLQRMPRSASHLPEGETCAKFRARMIVEPEFLDLDRALGKFRATTSTDFFDAGQAIDGHLASAYAIPHAASILLHEPFAILDDRGPTSSLARCFTSAKCVVNSTYMLYQSNNDLGSLDPFLGYVWTVIGRSLIRDFAVKQIWGDEEGAKVSRKLAEHCLMFTSHCAKRGVGVPVLAIMSKNLQAWIDDPSKLVPPDEASLQANKVACLGDFSE